MTVLPELLPLAVEMSRRKLTGIMNYTNPGAISHNEILQVGTVLAAAGWVGRQARSPVARCHLCSARACSTWRPPTPTLPPCSRWSVQLYKDYVDLEFTWSNFTVEEQAKVGVGVADMGWLVGSAIHLHCHHGGRPPSPTPLPNDAHHLSPPSLAGDCGPPL